MSLHFLFFVTALWFTSIAHALSIVYLSPAVIAIVSTQIFHERLSRVQIMGITLSIVGIAVMLGFELEISREKLVGDFFALLSGLMFAAYSILGRIHRRYISAFAYTSRIYSLASILALPMLIFSFEVANYSFDRIAALALAGIVPIGIGHTLYNTALKYLSATKVNLMASQEVTGGILLGGLFLAEIPSVTTIAGVILNLIGISLVLLQRRPTSLQDTRVSRDSD
jgi:drug/metabolite transporter (DMT)-like permease